MQQNLTINDLTVRQINFASVIRRILKTSDLNSHVSFYSDLKYWQRVNTVMRLFYIGFFFMCITQYLIIEAWLFLIKPFYPLKRLNLVI